MQSRKEDKDEPRRSNLRLTEGTPDAVHVGKCLKGSLANWWLFIDDYLVNLAMLRTLRQDYKSETGKKLRQESVRDRDKMSTDSVAEIFSEDVFQYWNLSKTDAMILFTHLYQKNIDTLLTTKQTPSNFLSTW